MTVKVTSALALIGDVPVESDTATPSTVGKANSLAVIVVVVSAFVMEDVSAPIKPKLNEPEAACVTVISCSV